MSAPDGVEESLEVVGCNDSPDILPGPVGAESHLLDRGTECSEDLLHVRIEFSGLWNQLQFEVVDSGYGRILVVSRSERSEPGMERTDRSAEEGADFLTGGNGKAEVAEGLFDGGDGDCLCAEEGPIEIEDDQAASFHRFQITRGFGRAASDDLNGADASGCQLRADESSVFGDGVSHDRSGFRPADAFDKTRLPEGGSESGPGKGGSRARLFGLDRIGFQYLAAFLSDVLDGRFDQPEAQSSVTIVLLDEEADEGPYRCLVDTFQNSGAVQGRKAIARGNGTPSDRHTLSIGDNAGYLA
ncbi:hypothetical protein AMJ71_10720 [candidate division TA06 bacterium SM1_40]|uniref:Uncharacterized protein n=1 Tax=candidate division TA06 bacterium SM1_40 TaxID=1703773 RepID=A0A0S8JBK4_UNCT6|nr:MAG: hypothetical protein AMJ71_10720 [candidate division TA06 bacterium SM1_40]